MSAYEAQLRMEGTREAPVHVLVDLTDDRMTMSIGGEEIADWSRNEIRVSALPDGFHIRAEGEAIVLDVSEDARFALDLGLKNAHPNLRRRMSALMRDDVES
jgi:hypothetical protein